MGVHSIDALLLVEVSSHLIYCMQGGVGTREKFVAPGVNSGALAEESSGKQRSVTSLSIMSDPPPRLALHFSCSLNYNTGSKRAMLASRKTAGTAIAFPFRKHVVLRVYAGRKDLSNILIIGNPVAGLDNWNQVNTQLIA